MSNMQRAFVQIRPAVVARRPVVCLANKNNIPMTEARAMSDEEVDAKVTELKGDLFKIRIKQATQEGFKPHEMKLKRKDIARLLTAKRERSLAAGVSKRENRRLEKKALVADGMAL